jgi:hypothetical protein
MQSSSGLLYAAKSFNGEHVRSAPGVDDAAVTADIDAAAGRPALAGPAGRVNPMSLAARGAVRVGLRDRSLALL